ncbi:diguanylate cyclase [Ideonella sp. BN130291]|uniref:diguanylate cyclase n=1 Tax=Ideonella sp. BN130291 TaxID=3112940 RepID=UPI002E277143|nr:diguanylate cyclase [Ideonella sp. BN130291]
MDTTAVLLRDTLQYLLMPLWLLAGFADWCCHRAQRIERTAGLKEALLHWLMLAEMGVAVAAAALLQVNAAVLVLMLAACVAHELTTWWDLAYATRHRAIPPVEQWVHSLQLVLPWAAWVALVLLHWPQAMAAVGLGTAAPDWSWRLKAPALPWAYLLSVALAGLVLVAGPFAEETWRCWRADAARGRSQRAAR